MFGLFKTYFSNVHVKESGNVADDNLSVINKWSQRLRIGDIDFGECASKRIKFFCQLFSLLLDIAGDMDMILL